MRSAIFACLALTALAFRPSGEALAESGFDWPLEEHAQIFDRALELSGLAAALDDGRPFTLFVPSDAALEREGTATLLEGVYRTPSNRGRLVELMSYHVVLGRKIDLDGVSSAQVSTLNGEPLSIDRFGGFVLLDRYVRVAHSIDLGHATIHLVSGLLWPGLEYDRSGREYQASVGGPSLN